MHTLTAALRAAAAAAFHGPPSHPAAAAEEEEEESLLYARVCLASKEGGGEEIHFRALVAAGFEKTGDNTTWTKNEAKFTLWIIVDNAVL